MQKEIHKAIREAFLSGELRVESVDPSTGEVSLHIMTDVLKHHTQHKRAFCLSTFEGDVVASEDHSFFVKLAYGIQETLTSELKIGDLLAAVVMGDVVGVPLLDIREIEARDVMYDLSVPDTENFVLTNSLLAHNSYSIGGISLDIEKSSKYESLKQNAENQLDKATQFKERTVKFIRGLQQPKYGFGVRSSFGPSVGRGVLSPRSFV